MTDRDVLEIVERIQCNWPEQLSVTTGDDDGSYINIRLDSADLIETWLKLKRSFLGVKLPCGEFRRACIITATGNDGWNDYLLLHHYDETEPLDEFPDGG